MAVRTTAALAAKLQEVNGNMAKAAMFFGVSRQAAAAFVKRHSTLQAVIDQSRESLADHAETALRQAVMSGESWAVKLTLTTLGKGRGYIDLPGDLEELQRRVDRLEANRNTPS